MTGQMNWILLPEVEELAKAFADAEQLLLDLGLSEEDSVEDPEPWVLPEPLAGRQALAALYQVWEILRSAMDEMTLPPIEPAQSTRPRLYSDGKERVPFRTVQIAAADRLMLAAAVTQLELALSPTGRDQSDNRWERKRLYDLAELLDQIADGQDKPTTQTELIRPLVRISALLNLPPDDATRLMVEVLQTSPDADVDLAAAQTTAYDKTATRINTILTGGDPLARWVY